MTRQVPYMVDTHDNLIAALLTDLDNLADHIMYNTSA